MNAISRSLTFADQQQILALAHNNRAPAEVMPLRALFDTINLGDHDRSKGPWDVNVVRPAITAGWPKGIRIGARIAMEEMGPLHWWHAIRAYIHGYRARCQKKLNLFRFKPPCLTGNVSAGK